MEDAGKGEDRENGGLGNVHGPSGLATGLEYADGMAELDRAADELVLHDMGCLAALCPVVADLPDTAVGGILHVENGLFCEIKRGDALAGVRRGRVGKLGAHNRRNGYLHLEAVAARVDEPCEGRLVVGYIGNEVVAAGAVCDAVPAADGEVGAGDDRYGCAG